MRQFDKSVKHFLLVHICRETGVSARDIATALGVTSQRVYQILTRELKIREPRKLNPIFVGLPVWMRKGREHVRERVRHRDGHRCQDCKRVWDKETRRFDVHHLNGMCGKKSRGYDRLADMDGLITLCHKCHYNRPEHRVKSKEWAKRMTKT